MKIGKYVFKELQVYSHILFLTKILLDQTGSVLIVELVRLQIVQLTQLKQDIAPLAIHQHNAQLVFLVFHITQLKTQQQTIVQSAKLDLDVQQSLIILKFHFHMLFACRIFIILLFLKSGKVMQITLHTHHKDFSLVEQVILMLMVLLSQEQFQI